MITSFLLATVTPSATGTPKVDADLVTPGLKGFLILFVLAVAVYFLGRSMARRVRRVNQRARDEAEEQETVDTSNVTDLMEVLQASVEKAKKGRSTRKRAPQKRKSA